MPVLGVIPARLGSTRLARKPLQLLGGEPLVVRVWQRVRRIEIIDELVVATDSPEIGEAVERAGGRAVLTSPRHESGTERVAEVARRVEFDGYDIVMNIQGDEPFLPLEAVDGAVARVEAGDDVGTAAVPLDSARANDPSRVKVVCDSQGRALYFSRARIPFVRGETAAEVADLFWHHLGIYAYRREALARWVALPPTDLERAERLEQLRPLYHGLSIGVALLDTAAPSGIDTQDDLERAERLWPQHAMGEGDR